MLAVPTEARAYITSAKLSLARSSPAGQMPSAPTKLALALALLPVARSYPGFPEAYLRAAQRRNTSVLPSKPDQLTLVLAARTKDQGGFPRLTTLMRSLGVFLDANMVACMLLVVPDGDVPTFSQHAAFQGLPWPLRLVPDSQLLSHSETQFEPMTPTRERESHGGRGTNYRMQMLTKIGVAQLVNTTFYLVLDCDVIATRRTTYADLVPGGRALIIGEQYPYHRHEARWWEAADEILHAGGTLRLAPGGPCHRSDARAARHGGQPRPSAPYPCGARHRPRRGMGRGALPAPPVHQHGQSAFLAVPGGEAPGE